MTEDNHEIAAATLRQKVDELTRSSAQKIAAICRRNNVPRDAADAMAADVADIYNAHYNGLHATNEHMHVITSNISARSWDRTENAALGLIPKYYNGILDILHGNRAIARDYLNAVVYCEAATRQNDEPPAQSLEDAQRLYYTYAVYLIAELCDVSPEELQQIPYYGKELVQTENGKRVYDAATHIYRAAVIARALGMQQQRRKLDAAAAERREARRKKQEAGGSKSPRLFADDNTIALMQNFALTLSNGAQTAGKDETGHTNIWRPLRSAIHEQRRAADAILNDDTAPDLTKKKATQLITTTTAIWQVLDGLQAIPQRYEPDGSGDTYTRYDMTPHEYARLCTGQDKPAPAQILEILRATAWLCTQFMRVVETATKQVTARDSDGKVLHDEYGKPIKKVIERQIYTTFQPITAEFRSEYEDNVLIEDATRVRLHIHKIITDGRSAEYTIDNTDGRKQTLRIKQPVKHILTLAQFYDVASDEERILRNILISKPKQAEDKLLAAVFGYEARQQEYNEDADEAQRIADALQQSTTATDEQKQAAQRAAQRLREKAKRYISDHVGDDVKRLKAMFAKAQNNGTIVWYSRDEAKTTPRKGKYGSGFVWTWERPAAEDVAKRRGRRRRQ